MDNTITKFDIGKAIKWISIAFIACFLIWGLTKSCQPPKPGIAYHDTLWKDSLIYVPTIKYVEVITPNTTGYNKPLRDTITLIRWKTSNIGSDDIIELERDSLHYVIKAQFLVNFPKNPKLIRQTITHDSTTYDFLHTDAMVWTNTYPIDLDRFNYVWESDSLKAQKRGLSKELYQEGWAYAGYDIFRNVPRLAVDYTLNYRKVGVFGRLTLTPTKTPITAEVGTRVKFK